MADHPYQLLPPLSGDEYAALRADIADHGIRVPVDIDETGQILDGHHRAAIAGELGVEYPTRVVAGLSEAGKAEHALTVNLARRQLSREQRRDLIRSEVQRTPEDSDRAIGRRCGCDHKTVGSVRRELSGEIPQRTELTTRQRRMADALVESAMMRVRQAADRIEAGEHCYGFTIFDSAACVLFDDDPPVLVEAWPRIAAAMREVGFIPWHPETGRKFGELAALGGAST